MNTQLATTQDYADVLEGIARIIDCDWCDATLVVPYGAVDLHCSQCHNPT